ncbi:MAG: hypothetical protein IJ985_07590 [Akkermansia sp.]|nr:hypothetical protein [Akkermansia sp.]
MMEMRPQKKNRPLFRGRLLKPLIYLCLSLLAEVALQEAFESLAVAGFIGLPPIKIFATLDFAYNFLQLFYNFESLHCNSFTTLYNFEELSARMLANA